MKRATGQTDHQTPTDMLVVVARDHAKLLVGYARRRVRVPWQDAEDLVQDLFVLALEKWQHLGPRVAVEGKGALLGWLFVALGRVCLAAARRESAQKRVNDDTSRRDLKSIQLDRAEHTPWTVLLLKEISAAYWELPGDRRAQIDSFVINGDSVRDAASAWKLPKSKAGRMRADAVSLLRSLIEIPPESWEQPKSVKKAATGKQVPRKGIVVTTQEGTIHAAQKAPDSAAPPRGS